jgi:hypothetical protein
VLCILTDGQGPASAVVDMECIILAALPLLKTAQLAVDSCG